jgi:acyl transferase domain-containing protein/NRPS condensation-like uncharacterized protein
MTTALKTPEIAIIGMAGRFPSSRNVEEFWLNIKEGRECISTFSDEELAAMGVSPQILNDPSYVKAGYEVEGMELFDAGFFGYTPREAELMDPQQRLFLECAWEALENAGLDTEREEGLIGLYAGAGLSRYLYNIYSNMNVAKSLNMVHVGLANDLGNLAMRVAYKLNLKGPSIALRTACSTSLVATHLACQALINEECDVALAGGVYLNLQHQPKVGYLYEEGSIFSPDGHCRAFDAKARGTVFGSGLGVVVLKRLDRALADGDCIRAVIKGSAINNDGALKVGYTAPSLEGQAEVIIETIANAGVDPETISYVEAHATGTSMGDPIEMAAITKAFRASTDKKNFCAIGSVKTNVGHLEAAAGVTALIKTVLALQHEMIPPSLHFEEPNPAIDFANSPFYVNSELREWQRNGHPRRAGVSSFGIGGTNAHLILEEAPVRSTSGPSRLSQLLLLSARSATALDQMTTNLADHLRAKPEVKLADVAYTLALGRRSFAHRRMVLCESVADAVQALQARDGERVFTSPAAGSHERPLVFMFSGQGSQQVNMGAGLYQSEPRFHQEVDRCAELLRPILGLDLREVLYPRQGEEQAAEQQLVETWLTQPALFVVEYALAQLWMSWGAPPAAMIGHSVGEYVAACVAGVMTLEEALRLVAGRGRLMQSVPPGAMLSVSLPEQELRASVNGQISLAAVNHPDTCVVAGETEAINNLAQVLEHKGVSCRQLPVSHAFHSRMMHAVREPFRELVESVRLKPPQLPFISSATGKWITVEQATSANYWVSQMCEPVRFADGVAELWRDSERVLLEVGPGQVLSNLARRHPSCPDKQLVLSSLSRNNAQEAEQAQALSTLGRMWAQGVAVKWPAFYGSERRQILPLPTYPFERRKYWLDIVDQQQVQITSKTIAHPLIDRLLSETVDQEVYATDFNVARHWVLSEHRITGQCILPGTAYLEVARAAASLYLGESVTCLKDVVFQTPLLVKENDNRQIQTVIRERDGELEFQVISLNDRDAGPRTDRWTTHARGIIVQENPERSQYNIAELERVCHNPVELTGNEGPHKTLEVGPRWQSLKHVQAGEGEAIAYLELPEEFHFDTKRFSLHPALLDVATSFYHTGERNHLYMPLGYDELRVYGAIPARCYAYSKQRVEPKASGEIRKKDVVVMDLEGNVVVDIKGFSLKKISNVKAKFRELGGGSQHYYEIKWRPAPIESVKESRAENSLLLFGDEDGLGRQVADLLRQQGQRVIEVEFGDEYRQISQDRYLLRTDEEDHARLIEKVADQQISQVLHLASVSRKEVADPVALDDSLNRGVYSLFHLTRALLKNKSARGLSFVVVSNNTDEVTGLEETINPAGACLFGVGRVLDHEQEGIRCRGLDIDEWTTAAHIKAELENDAESHQVAYRNGERFVGELKEAKLTSFPEIETSIEADGVYVITGGTGGIGLEISSYFAAKNQNVKLAWINRTPMPSRDQWDELLRDSEDQKLRRRIETIREIEASGGEVSFYTGDVSQLADVKAILSDLRKRYGKIRGVVHSAGIAGQGVIFKKETSAFRQTMSPKVAGTWNLDHATQADELDFFLMCSSSAVLWGLPGQADYTAANMYQDSFASSRAQRGKRTISINWPTWEETGMAVDHGVQKDSGFFKSISTSAGIERFDEILNSGIRRVIVGEINHGLGMRARPEGSLADLNFQFPIVIADNILNSFKSSDQGSASQALPEAVLKGREEHEYTTTERELARVWAKEMGLTEVDVFGNFYDVGGDSLIAIRIANTIKKYLGKQPHISDLLEYPTIAELARHLDGSVETAATETQHQTPAERFDLSTTQMGIWYLQKLNPQTTVYHVPASRVINQKVDLEKLQSAVNTLVRRHRALRTIFEEHEGAVQQVVLEQAEVVIEFIDVSDTTGNRELVENLIKVDSDRPFDFTRPLFRAAAYKLAEAEFYVSLNLHHLIADGWSVAMFWGELQTLYDAYLKGEELDLAPIELEFADFVADQKQWLNSSECGQMEKYWLQELAKPLPQLNLPVVGRANSNISTYDSVTIKLTAAERTKVRSLAQQLDVTLHTLLLATYCVALKKITGDSELIVGVPFSTRDRQELERVMGVFVNLISIRINPNGIGGFLNLVAKIREKSLAAYKNGKYPFDMLVEKLNPERRSGRNPIFSTMFQFEFMPSANQIPLIDLSVCGQEVDNEIEIRINYDATRLAKDSIDTLASDFMCTLRTVIATPDLSLSELEQIVGEHEKSQRLRKVESQGRLNLESLRSARREPIRVSRYGD